MVTLRGESELLWSVEQERGAVNARRIFPCGAEGHLVMQVLQLHQPVGSLSKDKTLELLLALESLTSSQVSLTLRGSGKVLAEACGWSDQQVAPARTTRFLPP